jgi:transposase-like protein
MGRPAEYPEEFRREAVELYRNSERSRAEVARSLGISDGSWVKAVEATEVASGCEGSKTFGDEPTRRPRSLSVWRS